MRVKSSKAHQLESLELPLKEQKRESRARSLAMAVLRRSKEVAMHRRNGEPGQAAQSGLVTEEYK